QLVGVLQRAAAVVVRGNPGGGNSQGDEQRDETDADHRRAVAPQAADDFGQVRPWRTRECMTRCGCGGQVDRCRETVRNGHRQRCGLARQVSRTRGSSTAYSTSTTKLVTQMMAAYINVTAISTG